MQVLNTNDTPPPKHNNSMYYSEGTEQRYTLNLYFQLMFLLSANDKRPSSLMTSELNEENSDIESPVRLVINNNSNHQHENSGKNLSTTESKSLVNLANNEKKVSSACLKAEQFFRKPPNEK
jgi:hypothetical protein